MGQTGVNKGQKGSKLFVIVEISQDESQGVKKSQKKLKMSD